MEANIIAKLIEERNEKRNMTTGEILPSEEARKDMVEKNKLFFFLMVKGLLEEYIDFCSLDREDWRMHLLEATMI
jgi:hypothetical protein